MKSFVTIFEMPLFMAISGYLLYFTIVSKKSTKRVILDKMERVALPCLIWELVASIPIYLYNGGKFIGNTWYLWCYFALSILTIIAVRIMSKLGCKQYLQNIILLMFGVVLCYCPTDRYYFAWMYPFLLGGYWWNQYNIGNLFASHKKIILLIIFLLMIQLPFWDVDYSVYYAGSSLSLHNIGIIYLFRTELGILGCVSFSALLWCVYTSDHGILKSEIFGKLRNKLIIVGAYSFEIYVLHSYIKDYGERVITHSGIYVFMHKIPFISNYICSVILMFAICFIIIKIVKVTEEKPIISRILWGRK